MEFKSIRISSKVTLEEGMTNALNQINKKLYETELKSRGVTNIIKLALVFKGKKVMINKLYFQLRNILNDCGKCDVYTSDVAVKFDLKEDKYQFEPDVNIRNLELCTEML